MEIKKQFLVINVKETQQQNPVTHAHTYTHIHGHTHIEKEKEKRKSSRNNPFYVSRCLNFNFI